MRLRIVSKTGKKHHAAGFKFDVDPRVIDTTALGPDQLSELLSVERQKALSVTNADTDEKFRDDGPTLEEFVAGGFPAKDYPPAGFLWKRSPGAGAYLDAQRAARAKAGPKPWIPQDAEPAPAKKAARG